MTIYGRTATDTSHVSEDVKARRDRMVGLVETVPMTANGLQLTAYGPDGNEMRIVEGAHG